MDGDKELISEVLKGNVDDFSIIINKYEITILHIIYNMIKDKEAAEDLTQETFITAYNKLYMYNSDYKFSNWIIQIAKNKTIDYIRKYNRVYEANIDDYNNIQSRDESPEQTAEFKETKRMIEVFISTLDSSEKMILNLRYAGEKSFVDIGEILNMNESAVKRKYYKIRDKFKSYRKTAMAKEG